MAKQAENGAERNGGAQAGRGASGLGRWVAFGAASGIVLAVTFGGPPDAPELYCGTCQAVRATVPIVFGLPGNELMEEAQRGEVVLGGCMVPLVEPLVACGTCKEPHMGWIGYLP